MKVLKNLGKVIAFGIIVAFLSVWMGLTGFITNVPTGSMLPTLQLDSKFLVVKDSLIKEYHRGDIVVFCKEDDPDTFLVKRVIGLPGEIIDIREGAVYVNGDPLVEDYIGSTDLSYSNTFFVPEDSYLFLGDNRAESLDARYWEQPFVHKDFLKGRIVLEVYPKLKFFG